MKWPLELREHCTRRMLGPNPPMLKDLAVETGIPAVTLSRWKCQARASGVIYDRADMEKQHKCPRDWSPAQRLRAVNEAATLSDEELGEFLRREGLHAHTLEQWRQDALAGLGASPRPGQKGSSRRERQLERELRRKNKALAEAAALLVLQKKSRELFGEDEDDSSDER